MIKVKNEGLISRELLPEGVARFNIINSFDTDLAQYFADRTNNLKLEEVSTSFRREIEHLNKHFIELNKNKELDTLEEDFNDAIDTASQLSYKSGFDDGIRFIIQSLLTK